MVEIIRDKRRKDCPALEHRVRDCLRRNGVRSVVVGVSGGADSTALLLALVATNVDLQAVHCNFHLRGEESDRDMRFTEQLCERLNVPLTIVHFDTESYRDEKGISTEMACRELRYDKFREILLSTGYDRIAVAHNADDQAETVLLNLMRGSGISGLRGMLEDTGEVIRPLLGCTRKEILEYLDSKSETYVTDSTNSDSSYRRNFLRNEVIPLLETRWPSARKSICRTAAIMAEEERVLEEISSDRRHRTWARLHGANTWQCDEIVAAMNRRPFQSGKRWKVPDGTIIAERNGLEFIEDEENFLFDVEVGKSRLEAKGNEFLFTTLPPDKLRFRHPRTGDRIRPLGMKGSMLVSKVMKDAKLSESEKRRTVVAEVVETGEVIWVEGLKRAGSYLLEPDSAGFCYEIISRRETAAHNHLSLGNRDTESKPPNAKS